jgi:hypothetical protein
MGIDLEEIKLWPDRNPGYHPPRTMKARRRKYAAYKKERDKSQRKGAFLNPGGHKRPVTLPVLNCLKEEDDGQ